MTDILVVNVGSSSVKYQLLSMPTGQRRLAGQVTGIGSGRGQHQWQLAEHDSQTTELPDVDHALALTEIFGQWSAGSLPLPQAVGHRVVHGGERFTRATLIDSDSLAELATFDVLAPLHNPVNRLGIEAAMRYFPGVPQVAVFDTAFHAAMPEHAFRYALPDSWYRDYHIRRYGFHGLAHASALAKAGEYLGKPCKQLNLITLHLGNGASACAIENGISIDTSMGFTPLAGLVMGTRSGDIDPGILTYLSERKGLTVTQIDRILNNQSGLVGLAGVSDMRDVIQRAKSDGAGARRAIDVFVYRIQQYVGAYWAVLARVDAVVFTGGIGQHSALIRKRVCQSLRHLGFDLDVAANESAAAPVDISVVDSAVRLLVVDVDEEQIIAVEALEVIAG